MTSTTTPLKLAIDIDGCLASFEDGFAPILRKITGISYPLNDPAFPPIWDWPQHYGASEEQVSQAWEQVKNDRFFWELLPPRPKASEALRLLSDIHYKGVAVVHYVTSRLGRECHQQTERWLIRHGCESPNVIVCSKKGALAHAIGIDVLIDDKPENLYNVRGLSPDTILYLVDRPYNRLVQRSGITRVDSTYDALIDLYSADRRPALAVAA